MRDKPLFRPNKRLPADGKRADRVPTCTLVDMMETDYLLPETKEPLALRPFQRHILNRVFTPFHGKLPYHTIVYSCPKKSGKTALAAAVAYAWAKTYGGDVYSIANDLTQAQERAFSRVESSLRVLREVDGDRFAAELDEGHHRSIAKRNADGNYQILFANGARLQAIPCDPYGEAGGMQTLTVWDELWAYKSDTANLLWTEMQPLPPGVGGIAASIRFVVTYAGWYGTSDLLYNIYEQVCQPDEKGVYHGQRVEGLETFPCYELEGTFVYWDHQARMPWHTPEFLQAARQDKGLRGRESEYLRIWENRWTTGLDNFIDMEVYDALAAEGERQGLYNHLEGWTEW